LDKLPSADPDATLAKILSKCAEKQNTPTLIACCGGGSQNFKIIFQNIYPSAQINIFNEIECTGRGVRFIKSCISKTKTSSDAALIVNIGTGISIIKEYPINAFSRIGGSCIGGGTFSGLSKVVLQDKNIDSFEMITIGNADNVDILVGEIYRGSVSILGVDGKIIAASLAKIDDGVQRTTFTADFCAGAARAICVNAAQLAYLYAKLEGIKEVTFTGGFMENLKNRQEISKALKYWSLGYNLTLNTCDFSAHAGCLGALDCALSAT